MPPLSSFSSKDEKKDDMPADAPPMRWTGSTVDLIELLYGLDTLKCINDGEAGMGELLGYFFWMFGLEIKDRQCYNTSREEFAKNVYLCRNNYKITYYGIRN